jgi:hypothetical protein
MNTVLSRLARSLTHTQTHFFPNNKQQAKPKLINTHIQHGLSSQKG